MLFISFLGALAILCLFFLVDEVRITAKTLLEHGFYRLDYLLLDFFYSFDKTLAFPFAFSILCFFAIAFKLNDFNLLHTRGVKALLLTYLTLGVFIMVCVGLITFLIYNRSSDFEKLPLITILFLATLLGIFIIADAVRFYRKRIATK